MILYRFYIILYENITLNKFKLQIIPVKQIFGQ